jgi:hypothetical protein
VVELGVLPGTVWIMAVRALSLKMVRRCILGMARVAVRETAVVKVCIRPDAVGIVAVGALPWIMVHRSVLGMA